LLIVKIFTKLKILSEIYPKPTLFGRTQNKGQMSLAGWLTGGKYLPDKIGLAVIGVKKAARS